MILKNQLIWLKKNSKRNLDIEIYTSINFWSNWIIKQGKISTKRSTSSLEKDGNYYLKGLEAHFFYWWFWFLKILYTY